MKRVYSFLLATLLLTFSAIPARASSDNTLEGELVFETVILGGKEVTVPTIVQNMNLTPYCLQDSNNGQVCGQTITYCIPVTEEALINHEDLIQSTFSTLPRSTNTTHPFLNGYLYITTTIFFSYQPAQKAPHTADFNYRLEGVSIDRNRDPEGLGTQIWGIGGQPVVDVHIHGAQELGGAMIQENTYSLNWGQKKDISSDFGLVVRSSVSYGYAKFSFYIINEFGRMDCVCDHPFVV